MVEIAGQIGLRAVQLHGFESAEDARWVAERVHWTIKAFPAGHRNIERFSEYGAQTLLMDGPNPGSGELFDWRLAEGVVDPGRLLVSGGLRPDNVAVPWPISILGRGRGQRRRGAPGVKDPGKVRDFILAARAAGRLVAAERRRRRWTDGDATGRRVRPTSSTGRATMTAAPAADVGIAARFPRHARLDRSRTVST